MQDDEPVAIAWLQLVGGAYLAPTSDRRSFEEDFSDQVTDKAWEALGRLQAKLLDEYDGAAWLAQRGYERVSLGLEYRVKKHGRGRSAVPAIGRLLSPEFSVVCPELAEMTVDEMVSFFEPVVLDALSVVGERKNLGPLPPAGQGGDLASVPLIPLIEDPSPYDEEPGDCFVITRMAPGGVTPELIARYEADFERLLSEEALGAVIEAETSSDGLRWVVRPGRRRRRRRG
ncbi:hypothetical protein AB0F43_35510 [Kribbella sp. NPDC023972]|uniref:hypothetical protein n=1 Tax=Kribbella sp. NPDC023972 TaxID=3154795 RepID=UPI0033C39045